MYKSQLETYHNVQKETASGRDLESMVLTKAALKLQMCRDNWDAPDRESRLDDALTYNQKIWSFFQGELSNPDNPLPKEIKENLLSLSLFIDKRIFEVMSYPSPDKLRIIIDINRNIAAGLSKTTEEQEAA